ncbi:S1C family serine protease [Paenibacillus contaminans]|uniref:Trypsin n=1 Tax=Paenibacillus contaminans TaxID=450362 RepID=A0A329N0M7_9BACL|nr:trypsin-like peptidase domain-containing protein [Paenibacillus contaminans]RAV23177.1 trypsin [Paenibacillus contaminans]
MSWRRTLMAVVLVLALVPNAALAASTENKVLDAKMIDGEVFVKASSVKAAFGGISGEYDDESESYTMTTKSPVTLAVEKTSPSVVAIIGKPKEASSNASKEDRYQLTHGTGVILKEDGWIVTNAHVVKDLKQIIVVTADGKQFAAKNPYLDEESDLALVKITAKGLPTASLAETADVEVGETVAAIGTPISFALRNSVAVGVVSGTNRSIQSMYRLLQTDAAINPGNSGGALVNLKGEVIGINSMKFAAVGVDNLGFAIPADTVRYVVDQFFTYGKVKRPSLGFVVEESWAAFIGLPTKEPIYVKRVESGSAAAAMGIKEGDVLYSIDNHSVTALVDLNELLKQYLPGQKVKIVMQSDGDLVQREITLEEHTK